MDEVVTRMRTRAEHHGPNVVAILPALRGYLEEFGTNVEVRTHMGLTGNVTWFKSKRSGRYYCFGYSHGMGPQTGNIELRANNIQGPVVERFTNSTSLMDLYKIFRSL
jgi:hypothetical protein